MKRVLSMLLAACLCCGLLAGCGGKEKDSGDTSEKAKKSDKKEYVSDAEIANVFSDPEKYKGKYIRLSGKVFNGPDKEENYAAYQAWHDITNAQNDFVFGLEDDSFVVDDYVMVDGVITGVFKGENMMGGTISCPMIHADSVEKLSYMEMVVPTIKEIVPENAVSEQNGISIKVDKVEFAEKETRVYMTETNSSADKFSIFTYDMKIIQNGQQIEQDVTSASTYEGNYAQLSSDILPNASSSGILVFPAIDSSASFQIYAEGFSDNWELEFAPFTINVAVQ
ncbi:MAG: hypothetical protein K1W22_18125 [Lachnospiraceae bacterium]